MIPDTSRSPDTDELLAIEKPEIMPLTSKLPDTEALASNQVSESTSRLPEIRRSLFEARSLPVVLVPSLEYEAEAPPATWREPVVRRWEAEAVPWTSSLVRGEVVPMPTWPVLANLTFSDIAPPEYFPISNSSLDASCLIPHPQVSSDSVSFNSPPSASLVPEDLIINLGEEAPLTLTIETTSNLSVGPVVPIPTFPVLAMVTRLVPDPLSILN